MSEKETQQTNTPFDLSQLRLSQNFAESAGVEKVITKVPVRKPNKQDFIRTHPNPEFRLETMVLEFKDDNEIYLVVPELWSTLPAEFTPKLLITTMNRQKVLSLWPIGLTGANGRHNSWNESATEAANMAQNDWIRVTPNMNLGAYEIHKAIGDLPDPEWPDDMDFTQILEIAFKGMFISDIDHPALRRLRGEA